MKNVACKVGKMEKQVMETGIYFSGGNPPTRTHAPVLATAFLSAKPRPFYVCSRQCWLARRRVSNSSTGESGQIIRLPARAFDEMLRRKVFKGTK